jgi:hypothetical protein
MSQTYQPTAALNASVEVMYPSSTFAPTASATNGTTTLTFTTTESTLIQPGMTVTGAGITSGGLVVSVVNSTGVVTISGSITTLTATKYTFTQTTYGSLHTATPGFTGASEVTGGSYARQLAQFGLPATGVKTSTDAQNWTSMPSVTVGYFGFWSASTSGTWLGGGALGSSLTVPSGATVAAAIGAITLTTSG